MTGVGGRFDLEAARREALEAKHKARVRAIMSNVTLGVVILALIIGGKVGWDKWQAHREAERKAAEEARIAAERAEAARKRAEAERRAKAEAERKAREEAREAERKAKAEAREAERRAREEEKLRAEERRREEERIRAEQEELKRYAETEIAKINLSPYGRLNLAYGLEDAVEATVDGERWSRLSSFAEAHASIDFLEMLRGSITNDFSESSYPDRETFARLLSNLDAERFTMIVKLKDAAKGKRLILVAGDVENGLAIPTGVRAIGKSARMGWTVPFTFGSNDVFFVMEQSSAERFAREWSSLRRKIRADAAKLDNRDEYVSSRLAKELPDFLRSVKVEIGMPPREDAKEVPEKTQPAKKTEEKKRPTLRGSGSGINQLGGPRRVR